MAAIDTMNVIISVSIAVIGFFLVQFYYMVKDMAKDVKELLIQRATHDSEIKQMSEDVHEIKIRQGHFDRKLNNLELEISKLNK